MYFLVYSDNRKFYTKSYNIRELTLITSHKNFILKDNLVLVIDSKISAVKRNKYDMPRSLLRILIKIFERLLKIVFSS